MPNFDRGIDGYTLVPNPFWGGVALPLVVFGFPGAFGVVAWWICEELRAGERVLADSHSAEAEARLAHIKRAERASDPDTLARPEPTTGGSHRTSA